MKLIVSVFCAAIVAGCVTRQQDHFYVLDAQPPAVQQPRAAFGQQVALRVTVSSVVDRAEIVLTTPGGVALLDHDRWAAPLADLVTTALSQDIEHRRADLLVSPRSAGLTKLPLINIAVDIDQISARLGNQVRIQAHWALTDVRTGLVSAGRDEFSAPLPSGSYAAVAAGVSACIGLLADRLIGDIPSTPASQP